MPKSVSPFVEFIIFGLKEAQACVFAGSFLVLLFLSNHIAIPGVYRYDFLFIAALLIQLVLYLTKLETKDEVKVIFLFHIIGLALEIFKTNPAVGSWSYPEPAFFKIGTVPLYSGFMYAAIGSYLSQAWKIFNAELSDHSWYTQSMVLCALIYANFFTNHWLYDFRWFLIAAVFMIFWKTKFLYTVKKRRSIPLVLAFVLIAFFIWVAENFSTYWGAWQYPYQIAAWSLVSFHKIASWFLMVIISFIIVADLKYFKKLRDRDGDGLPKMAR